MRGRRTAREGWTVAAELPSGDERVGWTGAAEGITQTRPGGIGFKKIRTAAGDCSSFGSLYTSPNIVTLAFASPPHPGICITRLHRGSSMMFRVWMASGESAKIGQPCWVEGMSVSRSVAGERMGGGDVSQSASHRRAAGRRSEPQASHRQARHNQLQASHMQARHNQLQASHRQVRHNQHLPPRRPQSRQSSQTDTLKNDERPAVSVSCIVYRVSCIEDRVA